jgi:hypothetical protein
MKAIWLFLCLAFVPCQVTDESLNFFADVIIYGGTPAAVTAAVQVSSMGQSVIIVSPDLHIGGVSTSGLGFTDTGNKEVIGGRAREFYQKIYDHYQDSSSWKWQKRSEFGNKGQGAPAVDMDKRTMWIFEPHVAESIFDSMISGRNIKVFRNDWLDRRKVTEIRNKKIISITTLSGRKFSGKVFIDATYEGDLMAAAGVSYTVGREANSVYNETWNGVQPLVFQHGHYFKNRIDPYIIPGKPGSGLLPLISSLGPGNKGDGDKMIQAYCYRTCLTKVAANRVPFTRPAGYDSTQYELLLRVFASGWRETFNKFDAIPNAKTDVNNHGPFSFDNIGMNYDYPEASYERRREILHEHTVYQQGLLWFISHDKRVPAEVREEMNNWGYSKDEFADNGYWPYQIYVREARRMKGEFVMTENEVMGRKPVPEPVGMGSYTLDSHNVQRYVTPEGFVQNEGDIGVNPQKPYQVSLGSILPKKEECRNLIVPVCVSSSHIAFGSIRMEPVYMILGQSAGTVAVIAIRDRKDIHDISYEKLKKTLESDGQIVGLK